MCSKYEYLLVKYPMKIMQKLLESFTMFVPVFLRHKHNNILVQNFYLVSEVKLFATHSLRQGRKIVVKIFQFIPNAS